MKKVKALLGVCATAAMLGGCSFTGVEEPSTVYGPAPVPYEEDVKTDETVEQDVPEEEAPEQEEAKTKPEEFDAEQEEINCVYGPAPDSE